MAARLKVPRGRLAEFCRRRRIRRLAFFGSVLREDFGAESDVDMLAEFEPNARYSLFDLVDMEDELKEIMGREVDLVTRKGIERSPNHIRRKAILGSAEVVDDRA